MNNKYTKKQADLILHGTDDDWCDYISRYAKGKRMPKLEPYIARFPMTAYYYAKCIIKGRWPEAEPAIANSTWAYNYAWQVIKDRWPKAEPAIMQNPWVAHMYAIDVIHGRWPEAEPSIRQHPAAWDWYTHCFPEVNT